MNHKPEDSEQVDEKELEEQERSDAELKQVRGGAQIRQKGSAPGYGPGTSINV